MPEFILWTEKYSVGNNEIDHQHLKLVKMINELYEAFMKKQQAVILNKIINELVDYTVYHFKEEQKYFYMFNYTERNKHLKQHSDFINKINEFKKDLEKGSDALFFKVINFLRTWLLNHIEKTDMQLKEYFLNK